MDSLLQQSSHTVLESLTSLPPDLFCAIGVVALFLIIALRLGKNTIVSLLLASYPAVALATTMPYYGDPTYRSLVSLISPSGARAAVFLVPFILGYFVLLRFVSTSYPMRSVPKYIEVITMSLATAGVAMADTYHLIFNDTMPFFSTVPRQFFSEPYFFLWLAAPLIVLIIFIRP